jgi:hemerythrin
VAIFEWKSEYDTGIAEIDNQHMVLVRLINELHELVNGNFDKILAKQIFIKLKNYAIFHFETEENLMVQYHYTESNFEAHLSQHRQFESEFESVQNDFENITIDECNIILSYLTNWLTNHICKVDKRLAEFIYNQRQASERETICFLREETLALSSSVQSVGNVSAYLNFTKQHVVTADSMLEQLELCMDDLKCQCDVLFQSTADSNLSEMSATAYSSCARGLNLVKSLKSSQQRLKLLLNEIEQSDS